MSDRQSLANARRVVVKVGTAVVRRPDGRMALGRLASLVEQVCALREAGREVLLVSSGAIGLGAERLGFATPPAGVVDRQACAAAGQGALMGLYDTLFGQLGVRCAQVLLTEADFHHRGHYVHLAATLNRLLALGAVPIINENDAVSTAELAFERGQVFGDNDRLSALVASGLGVGLLVLLSDVDGLYTGPPREPGSVRLARYTGQEVRIGAPSQGGRGGMRAKLAAARVAAKAGVHCVIGSGLEAGTLARVAAGEDVGTWFPAEAAPSSRRRWLAYATAPLGTLHVNEGARTALIDRKASLLPIGVVAVDGDFGAGGVVSVCCDGVEVARGLCGVSADEVRSQIGTSGRGRPVVHRDNLVILAEEGS